MYLFIGGSTELLLLIKLTCFKQSCKSTSTNGSHLKNNLQYILTHRKPKKHIPEQVTFPRMMLLLFFGIYDSGDLSCVNGLHGEQNIYTKQNMLL